MANKGTLLIPKFFNLCIFELLNFVENHIQWQEYLQGYKVQISHT